MQIVWYLELSVVAAFNKGDYGEAYTLYSQVAQHQQLNVLMANRQELWRILGAYITLLSDNKKVIKVIPSSEEQAV
ncbi:MAG: hypothetical protein M3Q97_05080 [Bacteroidota bacterium]|nr:hypothetical protein [Bacteroidota bacterium]